jgi:hypothetical protein
MCFREIRLKWQIAVSDFVVESLRREIRFESRTQHDLELLGRQRVAEFESGGEVE